MTSATSATWAAMPSRTAITRCSGRVARVMPVNEAVASGRHQGAASPASAGTHSTPSELLAATVSSSLAWLMKPRVFIHRTAEPAV